MAEAAAFSECLRNRCGLTAEETNAVIAQGFNTARKLRRIDKDSMKELFAMNDAMTGMNVSKRQNLRALRAFLQDCNKDDIDLAKFDENELEAYCVGLTTEKPSGKGDSDKGSDKPPIWEGDIFKFPTWLERFYAWIGLKQNSRGVSLTWLLIMKDTTVDAAGNAIEGPLFDEDPWSIKFRNSAPEQVRSWAATKLMAGPQYYVDTQELYNHLMGRIKGEPLQLANAYLNDGHRAFRALLRKYMSPEQRRLMTQAARERIPGLKYQSEKGKFGLRHHVATLGECFRAMEATGAPLSEEEKVMYLTKSINNDKLATGTISHIVASPKLCQNYQEAVSHILTTAAYLKITSPDSEKGGIDRRRGIGKVTTEGGRDLETLAKGYIQPKDFKQLSWKDKTAIRKYRKDKGINISRGKGGSDRGGADGRKGADSDQETKSAKRRKKTESRIERIVSAAVASAMGKSENDDDSDTPTQQHGGKGRQGNESNSSASGRFGRQGTAGRSMSAITSGERRYVGSAMSGGNSPYVEGTDTTTVVRLEADSHADTVCAGTGFRKLEGTGQICDVTGFDGGTKDGTTYSEVEICTVATAYDDPKSGTTFILIFGQALFFGQSLETSLMPPNQLRAHGLVVDDVPKQFTGGRSMHGIYVPQEEMIIPFMMRGMMSYIPTRLPTLNEVDNCRHVQMTSYESWRPYSISWDVHEKVYEDSVPDFDPDAHQVNESIGFSDANVAMATSYREIGGVRIASPTSSQLHRSQITAKDLAWNLGIGEKTADMTLKGTTQRATRVEVEGLTRRFRTRQSQTGRDMLSEGVWSDTFFSEEKSILGNTCAQMFTAPSSFVETYPMKTKSKAGTKLGEFVNDWGIPKFLRTDQAKEEWDGEWGRVRKHFLIPQRTTEPHSPWQNACEHAIGQHKKWTRRIKQRFRVPGTLWCLLSIYVAALQRVVVTDTLEVTGFEQMKHQRPDISDYTTFHFFETIKYFEPGPFPANVEHFGKWLGPSRNVGSALCYQILKANGEIIDRSTVRKLTLEEREIPTEKEKLQTFEKELDSTLGTYQDDTARLMSEGVLPANDSPHENSVHWAEELEQPPEEVATEPVTEQEITEDETLTNVEVIFPRGDGTQHIGKVIERKRGPDGTPIGRRNDNPIMDTREYVVQYPDGTEDSLTYAKVVEHIYSQIDAEGNQLHIFSDIVGHRKNKRAVDKADQFVERGGNRYKKKTTAGWDLEVEWKDGTTSWLPLTTLKKDNPLEVAQYAVQNKIDYEPAFDWWAKECLKRSKRLIGKARSRSYKRSGFKYGIMVPMRVNEAMQLDKDNGNDLWQKAIEKERAKVKQALKFLPKGDKAPPGYKKITGHWIFDVKMDLTRKARFVAGGHLTNLPPEQTYSSVVSRDTVRIMLTIAALNDLDVRFFDISNAYLYAETEEKVFFISGDEWGEELGGRVTIFCRAHYGLQTAGRCFHKHLAKRLKEGMKFVSSLADPDTWMRPAVKSCGFKYYEYVSMWVDDGLAISDKVDDIIKALQATYDIPTVKSLTDEGARYLGAKVGVYDVGMPSGGPEMLYPYLSAEEYIQKATPIVEQFYDLTKFSNKVPLPKIYHPELDNSKLLNDKGIQLYQSYMGILRWCVELGRIDIVFATALMAQYQALPRYDHLMALGQIFAYLKKHARSKIVMDPTSPDFSDKNFQKVDWSEFYPDAEEAIPDNVPEARGHPVKLHMFMDASHAANVVTRRSHSGFIIFIGRAPIIWYSKKQNIIESSTFGAEFVAMRLCTEANRALRYKLRMLGIPICGYTDSFSDNKGTVLNASVPESTLKKKHNSIAYHAVRWAAAAQELCMCFEDGKDNMADLLTKNLEKNKHQTFCRCIMW